MRVDIEELENIEKRKRKINDYNFDNIQWFKEGKLILVSKEMNEKFQFTGLLNTDFKIFLKAWENGR